MDPITAAFAAQLISSGLAQRANKGIQKNRGQYSTMERGRQAQYGKEAMAAVDKTLTDVSLPAREALQGRLAAQYEAALQPSATTPSEFTGTYQTGSQPEVKGEIARRVHDALVAGREHAKTSAALGVNARADQVAGLSLADTQQKINTLAGFSRGSNAALESEFDYANKSMGATKMASDIAGLVGQGALLYGLTNPSMAPGIGPGAGSGLKATTRSMADPGLSLSDYGTNGIGFKMTPRELQRVWQLPARF